MVQLWGIDGKFKIPIIVLITVLSNSASSIIILTIFIMNDVKYLHISKLIIITLCFNGFNSVYESILIRYKLFGMLFIISCFESVISLMLILIH